MVADQKFVPVRIEVGKYFLNPEMFEEGSSVEVNPDWWAIKVVDARTGEILPVLRGFTVNFPEEGGDITADVTLIISEIRQADNGDT